MDDSIDELLSYLFELNFDRFTPCVSYSSPDGEDLVYELHRGWKPNCLDNLSELYREINGEPYLINRIKENHCEVGLRAKIPNDMLTFDGTLKKFTDLTCLEQTNIFSKLKNDLFFTNTEILLTNILLDKFLRSNYNFEISIKEIERFYRRKAMSNRNITLNEQTYNRYISVLNGLCRKEIYLITDDYFRDKKYGSNNRNLNQKFLTILEIYQPSVNNISFSYSFGAFGEVLKLSRRYSDAVPAEAYRCGFNQAAIHSFNYYMGQQIFIEKYAFVTNPYLEEKQFFLDI